MKQIKVGDKVRTRLGYYGTLVSIYGDGRAIVDLGNGEIYGCCIQALTKVEFEENQEKK